MDDSSHQNMDNASSHERMFEEEGIQVMHPARNDSDDMASVDERLEF